MMQHMTKRKKSQRRHQESSSNEDSSDCDEENISAAPKTPSVSFTQQDMATFSSSSAVQVTFTQEQLLLLLEAQRGKAAGNRR